MNLFQQGGPMMWPLLAISATALAVMAERFVIFTTTRFPSRDMLAAILDMLLQDKKNGALELVENNTPFSQNSSPPCSQKARLDNARNVPWSPGRKSCSS